jgi:hypothetical protein
MNIYFKNTKIYQLPNELVLIIYSFINPYIINIISKINELNNTLTNEQKYNYFIKWSQKSTTNKYDYISYDKVSIYDLYDILNYYDISILHHLINIISTLYKCTDKMKTPTKLDFHEKHELETIISNHPFFNRNTFYKYIPKNKYHYVSRENVIFTFLYLNYTHKYIEDQYGCKLVFNAKRNSLTKKQMLNSELFKEN